MRPFAFTERESQLLRLLVRYKDFKHPIQEVADALKISPQGVKMALWRMRRRYLSGVKFTNEYRRKRKQLPVGRYL